MRILLSCQKTCLAILAGFALSAERAYAGSQPAISGQSDGNAPLVDDVHVTGNRPSVVSKIDRQTYDIKANTQAQTSPVIDFLGKLPAVSVDAYGTIMLLGQSGVSVLIDGKAPINTDQALKTLFGSEVDRIEVMTNPSAQFSAEGAAGIINIITKRRHEAGLSGNVLASGDSYGAYTFSGSPTWTLGNFSLGGTLGVSHSVSRGYIITGFDFLDETGASVSTSARSSLQKSSTDNNSGNFRLGYKLSEASQLTVAIAAFDAKGSSQKRTAVSSENVPFSPAQEADDGGSNFQGYNFDGTYERTGRDDGEELTITVSSGHARLNSHNKLTETFPSAPSSNYRTTEDLIKTSGSSKLDYTKPFNGSKSLSLGISWQEDSQILNNSLENLVGPEILGEDFVHRLSGERDLWAGYMIFQTPWRKWTIQPGLRAEADWLTLNSGLPSVRRNEFEWFPSLNVTRGVTNKIQLTLSYSKRIDRPDINQYDPSIQYISAIQAQSGNPQLKPVRTDSFEGRLDYTSGKTTASLTLFDRSAADVWSSYTTALNENTALSTTINAGKAQSIGAELSLRGEIRADWKYSVTTDIYDRINNTYSSSSSLEENLNYSAKIEIDRQFHFHDSKRADVFQVSVTYDGPYQDYQSSYSGRTVADVTWLHPLAKRYSISLAAIDIFGGSGIHSKTRGQQIIQSQRGDGYGPRFKISVTKQLGEVR